MNINVLRFDTIDSTNSEAARRAKLGADEGLCIIAREQTAGRGRRGRLWVSNKDAGLYFSIVLRPKLDARHLPLITLMTGIAVYDTLEGFGLKPDIKWVNDILINDKKICGILAETMDTPSGLAVIVGIGVNLAPRDSEELSETATSINELVNAQKIAISDVQSGLIEQLRHWYAILSDDNGNHRILAEWRRRSTYFSGKQVRIAIENETFEGVTDGLEENGALRVRIGDGGLRIVQAGDVGRLRDVRL